ncbi:MAG: response regulator [Zetaproteobacteria bacterium CG12_big_fil_rev_8_21_14_0_65_54_13]|nr:MAG: response regulator [Zetaproteobacteria bacterium CG23_combo_of_CG06-09_8_20_14_all_54_7]PIW51203.1 MAG: response regulator [Zetaproteobacteria bacterium CG12_big_fil_rev_8_21_14_0_65_54_13]PIX53501.1 MAG: response regulator [Zetaproteobacteria bacterium CG_4_10_14_3_um_filter_54_28]PJA28311.1 MAG: response regulator [Zetaproteobacteria bacterium CG_4_9_14_3_um_filter_54_145]
MLGEVLVIDDAKVVRTSLGRIMRRCGYALLEAENGELGLQLLALHPEVRVVFLDINMPVMDGMTFLEQIKSRFADRELPPVIIVSTETEMKSILKALALGASEYVMKPFDESIIKSKLDIVGIGYNT